MTAESGSKGRVQGEDRMPRLPPAGWWEPRAATAREAVTASSQGDSEDKAGGCLHPTL